MNKLPLLKPRQKALTFLGHYNDFHAKTTIVSIKCNDVFGAAHVFQNGIDIGLFEGTAQLSGEDLGSGLIS